MRAAGRIGRRLPGGEAPRGASLFEGPFSINGNMPGAGAMRPKPNEPDALTGREVVLPGGPGAVVDRPDEAQRRAETHLAQVDENLDLLLPADVVRAKRHHRGDQEADREVEDEDEGDAEHGVVQPQVAQ